MVGLGNDSSDSLDGAGDTTDSSDDECSDGSEPYDPSELSRVAGDGCRKRLVEGAELAGLVDSAVKDWRFANVACVDWLWLLLLLLDGMEAE